MHPIRASRCVLCAAMVLAGLSGLGGCASTRTAAAQAEAKPLIVRGERGAYRFDMSRNGRRMTADEFDAWMKANGIRIAKGAPAGKASGKPKAAARKKAAAQRPVASAASGG